MAAGMVARVICGGELSGRAAFGSLRQQLNGEGMENRSVQINCGAGRECVD